MRKGRRFRRVLARIRVKKLAARHFKGKMTGK
jgi:hypothetical protein